ncbi:hypothetical protein AKO1_013585 [Acrasis kona]|uniref:RGS13 n=1 Tax=Acrasis kona TaxID=1008807 RepID=A0AAW2YVX2_9EUKA
MTTHRSRSNCIVGRTAIPPLEIMHIIEHPSLVHSLLKLSQQMHSEEYILLLIDIHDYHNSDAYQRLEKASFIYRTYIHPMSPMDVGVSQKTRRDIQRKIFEEEGILSRNVFSELECEVIRCTDDMLSKFKSHPVCVEITNQRMASIGNH